MSKLETCGEILEPFLQIIAEPGFPNVQIIGGNGSAALTYPQTTVDLKHGTIDAPPSCDLDRFRKNGSLRDADVLVLSASTHERKVVARALAETVGDRLERSVFGFKPLFDLCLQLEDPIGSTINVFLGDRYMHEGEGYKALFPFQAPIKKEAHQTFMLHIDGRTPMPTSHPGATILNYLTRSISGARPKDLEKLTKISDNVLSRYPEVLDWIQNGPGKSMMRLARVLHTLREPAHDQRILRVGKYLEVRPFHYDDLPYLDLFMYDGEITDRAKRLLVAMAHLKARGLHTAESQEKIVAWWQDKIEQRAGKVIHNS